MNMYADEKYYNEEYLAGKESVIPAGSFVYYSRRASHQINRYTYGRLIAGWDVTEAVKQCCCELAEYMHSCDQQKEQMAGRVSYSNDGQSGTFDTVSYTEQEKNKKIRSIIRDYLADTGLLFQGRYKEECHES